MKGKHKAGDQGKGRHTEIGEMVFFHGKEYEVSEIITRADGVNFRRDLVTGQPLDPFTNEPLRNTYKFLADQWRTRKELHKYAQV